MGSWSTEARVGVFVLAALVVLLAFVAALGDVSLSPRYRVYADFGYSGSLQVGAPVKVSGIRVGKVASLDVLGAAAQPPAAQSTGKLGQILEPLVRAELELDAAIADRVTRDAQLYVGMQGVIGEAYLELTPGHGEPIPENGAVRGVDAPRLHVMALQLASTLNTVSSLVGTLDPTTLESLGRSLAGFVGALEDVLGDRRAELSQAVVDLAATAADLRVVMGRARELLAEGGSLDALVTGGGRAATVLAQRLPSILERGERGLATFESVAAQLGAATGDVRPMIERLRETANLLEGVAEDAHNVMQTIREGRGTIGGLISDPQLYDDMKEMMRDLRRHPWKVFWRD